MTKIYTLTLAPSLDSATQTPQIYPEGKLRCSAPVFEPGGGGINVARAVTFLGGKATAIFPVGGATGEHLAALLADEQVPVETVETRDWTRQNLHVHVAASGEQYRFVMPGAALTDDEFRRLEEKVLTIEPGSLLVVCGKGNNGGDGFVIARAAAKDGWNVTVFLAEGEPKTADAILNFERLHSLPVHICTDGSVLETQSFAAVVDALYGTGFHGELRPSGLAACGLMRRLHKSGAFVLAVDLPSGINTDTGEVAEGAAHADLTVTFDSYKPLHIAEASAPLCGKIVCADIGIRDEWHSEF